MAAGVSYACHRNNAATFDSGAPCFTSGVSETHRDSDRGNFVVVIPYEIKLKLRSNRESGTGISP